MVKFDDYLLLKIIFLKVFRNPNLEWARKVIPSGSRIQLLRLYSPNWFSKCGQSFYEQPPKIFQTSIVSIYFPHHWNERYGLFWWWKTVNQICSWYPTGMISTFLTFKIKLYSTVTYNRVRVIKDLSFGFPWEGESFDMTLST